MEQRYKEMDRKSKQLFALQYPYVSDSRLFVSTKSASSDSIHKFINKKSEIKEFKELAAQDDVSLMKRQNFVTGAITTTFSETVGLLGRCLSRYGDEFYRNALEKSVIELDPVREMRALAVAQAARLEQGIMYEQEVGLGNNAETENCRAGYQSILKDLFEMEHGRKYDIHTEHNVSLSDEFMNIDLDNNDDEEEYYEVKGEVVND